MGREILQKIYQGYTENFNLSNVMLTVLFIHNHENVKFIPVTFRPGRAG
jgi:hypothetical protein